MMQQPAAPAPQAAEETFVAPRAPAPGTPSPEAIVRLQQAAQRHQAQAPAAQQPAPQPQQTAEEAQEQRRFGLNSLINRMTGQQPAEQPAAQPRATRVQPSMQPVQAAQPQQAPQTYDEDQERIEIPAFLRRQAN